MGVAIASSHQSLHIGIILDSELNPHLIALVLKKLDNGFDDDNEDNSYSDKGSHNSGRFHLYTIES